MKILWDWEEREVEQQDLALIEDHYFMQDTALNNFS